MREWLGTFGRRGTRWGRRGGGGGEGRGGRGGEPDGMIENRVVSGATKVGKDA